MKNSLLYLLLSFLPWLPGCFSERRSDAKLEEIKTILDQIRADTGRVFTWGAEYKIPFDTTIHYPDLHFVASAEGITSGQPYTVLQGAVTIVMQYDTTAGVVRGTVIRAPDRVQGSGFLQAKENLSVPGGTAAAITPFVQGCVYPAAPWWKIAGIISLLLGGMYYVDRRWFPS